MENFPDSGNYVVFGFGQLASNKAIINGMKTWGKMTEIQAKSYINPGSGPRIIIVDDFKDFFVSTSFANFPVSLNLNFNLVHAFETRKSSAIKKTGKGKDVFQVGVTMLGMIIRGHLAKFSEDPDDRDFSKVLKRVTQFEEEVYGGVSL
jgi:hypothetical protein